MVERLTRQQSRQRTRTAILDAAEGAFATRGYRSASLEDIAATAGFTKGAVYSNFGSKADLFLALLDRRAERDGGAAPPTGPAAAADLSWSLATLDFLVDAVDDEPTRQALATRYEQARARTGEHLARTQAAPAWGTWNEIASVAMALGSGLIIQSIIDPDAIAPDLFGRAMTTLITSTGTSGTPPSATPATSTNPNPAEKATHTSERQQPDHRT